MLVFLHASNLFKMKKELTIAVLIVVLFNIKTSAQFVPWEKKYIQKVQECPLAVVLMQEDPFKMKKLADKPEELLAYQASVKTYNETLQEILPREWGFSSVEFIGQEKSGCTDQQQRHSLLYPKNQLKNEL